MCSIVLMHPPKTRAIKRCCMLTGLLPNDAAMVTKGKYSATCLQKLCWLKPLMQSCLPVRLRAGEGQTLVIYHRHHRAEDKPDQVLLSAAPIHSLILSEETDFKVSQWPPQLSNLSHCPPHTHFYNHSITFCLLSIPMEEFPASILRINASSKKAKTKWA